jgi:hypothetical protein
MLFGFPQSIATLLTIILFYAMDFVLIHRCNQKEISKQLSSHFALQIQYGA